MKWPYSRQTENEGLLHVQQIVNQHGSIFRKIHQEEDIGIDATIELVEGQNAQGLIVAVQIKSGESYTRDDKFVVAVDEVHLKYWQQLMLPVVLICYSPVKKLSAWLSVNRYIANHHERNTEPIKSIEVPFRNVFDSNALDKGIRGVALEHKDRGDLFQAADLALSVEVEKRKQGILLLSTHPQSNVTKLTAYLASQLILDEDLDIVRLAASALGYCVAHRKWSFYPKFEVMDYARFLCMKLDERHVRKLMEAIDDGDFGPMSLGEACIDCIGCMWGPDGEAAARNIVLDKNTAIQTRVNALGLFYGGDWNQLLEDQSNLRADNLGELVDWLESRYSRNQDESTDNTT